MANKKIKQVADVATEGKTLQFYFAKAAWLLQLENTIKPLLDEPLRSQIKVANFRDNVLVLAVASATWLTPLRYQTPSLITQLQTLPKLKSLTKIDFCVIPDLMVSQNSATPLQLSSVAAQVIAATEVSYEPLQQALRKLAQNSTEK